MPGEGPQPLDGDDVETPQEQESADRGQEVANEECSPAQESRISQCVRTGVGLGFRATLDGTTLIGLGVGLGGGVGVARGGLTVLGAYRSAPLKGSHHIFTLEGRQAALNLQPDGSKAKAYQVRQVRRIITEHKLTTDEDK